MAAETTHDDEIARRARRVVASSGLTQEEIAERAGIHPTSLSKALRGKRRFRDAELRVIARIGKVPVRYLRTGDGAPGLGAEAEADAPTGAARTRQRADTLDPEQRRLQILAATARLIARQGFHRVRVADIARECGTSSGTIHYHFPSKTAALRSALTFYADRFHAQLSHELELPGDVRTRLRRLIELQLPSTEADRDEWSIWIQFWNESMLQPALRPAHREMYTRWRDIVVRVLRDAADAGLLHAADVVPLADRFTGMVDGLAIQVVTEAGDLTVAGMRDLLLDAFEPHISLRPAG